ncbi:MAG: methyltransferase [Armatimonadetes bacterium]|nr:methyltransferase [Armatimonadota bacterium]
MTSRERVIRTLQHQPVDRAPRELWALPGVTGGRADEYRRLLERFPPDFAGAAVRYGDSGRASGQAYTLGEYYDEWGCGWRCAEDGVAGEVFDPPLADWSSLTRYELPWELLDGADFSQVDSSCAATDRFVKVGTHTRPFERLQFLRGSQALFEDLAYGTREMFELLAQLHAFYCREMEMWAATDVDAVSFMDDWGAQNALLISPAQWREVFKPLYRDYCDILHAAGKYVFFHSDGHIVAIYPDLIEIGVDAVNSQLFCMDIEELGRLYRGRITFWGEISRQDTLPFGTPDDCRAAVRRVRAALDDGHGGVIAQCEWGKRDPYANIEAVFEEWERPCPSSSSQPTA